MDPLTLLREFNVGQKLHEVQVVGDHIQFGTSYVFPRSAYTAFRGECILTMRPTMLPVQWMPQGTA
eukprot:1145143-Pelagomonas_calceolata.AAC.8